ncbi:MAG: hypothetical protein QXK88_09540 [Desulfurococcaceae archaeon]
MKSDLATMVYAIEAICRAGYKCSGMVEFSFVIRKETAGGKTPEHTIQWSGDVSVKRRDHVIIPEPGDQSS